jgi:hypothetical protein
MIRARELILPPIRSPPIGLFPNRRRDGTVTQALRRGAGSRWLAKRDVAMSTARDRNLDKPEATGSTQVNTPQHHLSPMTSRVAEQITIDELTQRLKLAWSRDTSYWPDRWSRERPAIGQCAVTALVVQDLIGGKLIRAKLDNDDEHYWNVSEGGEEIDLTRDQFEPGTNIRLIGVADRAELFNEPGTGPRYHLLKRRAGIDR